MKATPYSVDGEELDFSYKRNSKIKYISERTDGLALTISRRLEDALALNIFRPGPEHRLTAENYQCQYSKYFQSFTILTWNVWTILCISGVLGPFL